MSSRPVFFSKGVPAGAVLAIGLLFCAAAGPSRADNALREKNKKFMHGPLKISADETVSRDQGRRIEGEGNVSVTYETENGDFFRSFSRYARYDEKEGLGEIWGQPRAAWKRPDGSQPETRLWADKIILDLNASRLTARGRVSVQQSSSTLRAGEIHYFNLERRMSAEGDRPLFILRQPDQRIRISAEKIVALTETKQIHFENKVQGLVEFSGRPQGGSLP